MKKLSLIALSLSVILFVNNAYANALPNTTPQPTNPTLPPTTTPTPISTPPPTNIPAPANDLNYNRPTTSANDSVYGTGGGKSTFGKIAGNLKKIARPDIITVGVGLGTLAVDYVMNPDNNRPQPKEDEQPQPQPAPAPQPQPVPAPSGGTACKVGFGSNKLDLSSFVAEINSRTSSAGKPFTATADSVANLARIESKILSRDYKTSINWRYMEHSTIEVEFDNAGRVGRHVFSASAYLYCPEPQPKEEENPQEQPQPQPQPQDKPQPQPQPQPQDKPQPQPQPQPQDKPQPQPQPQPQDKPQPQPQPQPQDEYELNLELEFPAFCDWAKPVCDFIDWFKKDDNSDDTEIDIPEQTIQPVDTNIKFNGQCPNDIVYNVSFAGKDFTLFHFEWSKFCQFLSYLKWVIIAMASFGAVKIVGGINVSD